jgi:hypothetical protein
MTMKKNIMIAGALAVCFGAVTAQAQLQDLYFSGNGSAVVDEFAVPFGPTTLSYSETAFVAPDLDPSVPGAPLALTFALPNWIGPGVVDIYTPSSVLVGAISFYDIGDNGFMAEYANIGGQLDETTSGGYVPTPGYDLSENAAGDFIWEPGGSYRANNDYFGTITSATLYSRAPDGASTLGMLGAACTLLGAFSRKLRK